MSINEHSPETIAFLAQVERTYTSLTDFVSPGATSLGGRLLYTGELDKPGRTLAVAANIAGAATLAASADAVALRQAMRDGVIDFLVNSLDEALRILKNEIRKCEPVSVAVSVAPEAIEREMQDCGVLPDLLPPQPQSGTPEPGFTAFETQGARRVAAPQPRPDTKFLIWQIPEEYVQHPADFDAQLLKHVPENDHATRHWLRLSPRYLGAQARRLRSLRCDEQTASSLIASIGPALY